MYDELKPWQVEATSPSTNTKLSDALSTKALNLIVEVAPPNTPGKFKAILNGLLTAPSNTGTSPTHGTKKSKKFFKI